jgi:outer membrane biosynthesis protein TonB
MALHGDLGDFALADVFRLVTLSGKTGVLRLQRPDAIGSVWFRAGEVFFATSDRRTELLGQRLSAAGRVTPAQLDRALRMREAEHEGGRRLGEIMIDEGMIAFPVLEAFVQEQIQDTIFDLFLWDAGEFEFEPLLAPPEDQDIGLSVSVENIIMEGARRMSEWSTLRSTAPNCGVVYRLSATPGEGTVDISLTPDEWRVLVLTDGTRSAAEIARAGRLPELEVARTLHGLLGAGLLEAVDTDGPERLAPEALAAAVVPHVEPAPRPEPAPAHAPESVPEPAPARVPEPAPEPEPDFDLEFTLTPEPEPEAIVAPEPEPEPVAEPVFAPAPAPAPASRLTFEPASTPGSAPIPGLSPISEPWLDSQGSGITSGGLWSGLGEELTALTGSTGRRRSRRSAATPTSTAADREKALVHHDARVSRETIQAILEGIEKL